MSKTEQDLNSKVEHLEKVISDSALQEALTPQKTVDEELQEIADREKALVEAIDVDDLDAQLDDLLGAL